MRTLIRPGIGMLAVVLALGVSTPTQAAQQPRSAQSAEAPDADQQPKPTPQKPRPPEPAPRPEGEKQPRRQMEGRPVNIQVELTITDQVESEPGQKKTVSMIVADRAPGRIRSVSRTQVPSGGWAEFEINVDATPAIQPNDTVRLQMTLQYRPSSPTPGTESVRPSTLNESLTVILQPGKPLTVSRAVDPLTNRRTLIDVTATILK